MPFVTRPKKYFSKYKQPLSPLPNLLENQLESFDWLVREGLKEVFKEFSPINDYSGKKFELSFSSFTLGEPKFTETYAKTNKLTYNTQFKGNIILNNTGTGGINFGNSGGTSTLDSGKTITIGSTGFTNDVLLLSIHPTNYILI